MRKSGREASDLRWQDLRVGASLLAALAVIAAAVFSVDLLLRETVEGREIVISALEARDLVPGAEVWIAGRRAGRVGSIEFREPTGSRARRVIIRANVRSDAARSLLGDASAEYRKPTPLAPAVLHLDPGTPGLGRFDPSDTLPATRQLGREEALELSRELRGRIGRLDSLSERLRVQAEEGDGSLASLRRDTALIEELRHGLSEAGTLWSRAKEGTAARLLTDDALRSSADSIVARARRAAGDRRDPEAERTRAALARGLDRLGARLERLEGELSSGRGTAGRLLRDRELRHQRQLLRARVDSARAELLEEPLRWLRFRLF